MSEKDLDQDVDQHDDQRKYRRIKISNLSKINEADCQVLNVSREGLLLASPEGELIPHKVKKKTNDGKSVEIQLRIKGDWVPLNADIVWAINDDVSESVFMGVFVTEAPDEYLDFVNNLYLETEESAGE